MVSKSIHFLSVSSALSCITYHNNPDRRTAKIENIQDNGGTNIVLLVYRARIVELKLVPASWRVVELREL